MSVWCSVALAWAKKLKPVASTGSSSDASGACFATRLPPPARNIVVTWSGWPCEQCHEPGPGGPDAWYHHDASQWRCAASVQAECGQLAVATANCVAAVPASGVGDRGDDRSRRHAVLSVSFDYRRRARPHDSDG